MTNIAVIVLDTLRRDAIGPYNPAIIHTPHIDAVAADSTTHTTAIAQAPWSLPSQSSLLTGQYPWEHGAGQQQPFLPADAPLLQQQLRESGYRTAAIHNNTWLVPATGAMAGFETIQTPANLTAYATRLWRVGNQIDATAAVRNRLILSLSNRMLARTHDRPTDLSGLVSQTTAFLDGDTPFFLYCNLVGTHYPYTPPEAYHAAHGVETACSELDSLPTEYGGRFEPRERAAVQALYAAAVDYLDDVFGRIIEAFKQRGLYEDTLLIVAADHGELLGEDDRLGHHFSVRPELTTIPLFIKPPGGGGGESDEVTELRELYYLIRQQAGHAVSDDGRLAAGCGAGLYGEPTIYRGRLSDPDRTPPVSQFYVVSEDDRYVEADLPSGLTTEQLRSRLRNTFIDRQETTTETEPNQHGSQYDSR